MSGPTDDEHRRALEARKRLRRRARAAAFEAYEDAELRREEEIHKLSNAAKAGRKSGGRDFRPGMSSRKVKPSQRGK